MRTLVFTAAFLLLCAADVNGYVFPCECVQGVKKFPVPCCPSFEGSACGSHLGRGNCVPVASSRTEEPANVMVDERLDPGAFFNATCQCKENFSGYKCHECKSGYKGNRCEIAYMRQRRNIMNFNNTELESYKKTLHYCKSKIDPEYCFLSTGDRARTRSYQFKNASHIDIFSFLHNYATAERLQNGVELGGVTYAHGGTAFLTWHRCFLILFEQSIQRCIQDPNFALPYWKWEVEPNGTCTPCTNKYFGSNDFNGNINQLSVFSEWRLLCTLEYTNTVCITDDCPCQRPKIVRMPGLTTAVLPNNASVSRCYTMPQYDATPFTAGASNSFRACCEGNHNSVHLYLSGTMGITSQAASDPIFYLHHCNVDRQNDVYIRMNNLMPSNYPPNSNRGHGAQHCMIPYHQCPKNSDMLRPCFHFGYEYTD